jgi:hypothetical protein
MIFGEEEGPGKAVDLAAAMVFCVSCGNKLAGRYCGQCGGDSQSTAEHKAAFSSSEGRRESCHSLRFLQRHLLLRIPPHATTTRARAFSVVLAARGRSRCYMSAEGVVATRSILVSW